ncbi:MAG: protein-disulfide reductase DsbD family protein [Pseudomonadales bacterium]
MTISFCHRTFLTFLLLFVATTSRAAGDFSEAAKPAFGQEWASSNETVEFLPVEEAYKLLAERSSNGDLSFSWSIAEGYYLYGHAFSGAVIKGDEEQEMVLNVPPGLAKTDEYFGDVEVYYHNALISAQPALEAEQFSITSQGCADAGLCYPPRTQYFAVAESGELLEQDSFGVVGENAVSVESRPDGSDAPSTSFLMMVLFAFLGGMVLNLMPCVFPVLALKVLGLVNAGVISREEQKAHGLSYSVGVVVSFLAVGGVLLALRAAGEALGWGFQLQTPWIVASLAYLFFALALSLSGFIEFGASWAGAGQNLTERSGHSGSFFTGVLAVVVASPCTAPFMGAALGFALVQPPLMALSIFAALGLGMAAPFVLLVWVPALAQMLPRPGPWMVTFKEVMAVPLYVTAIWLIWVVGRQTGVDGMAAVLIGCVLIFLALWLWRGDGLVRRLLAFVSLALAISLAAGPFLKERVLSSAQASNAYSAEKVLQLRANGQPVFVNLTADWCITCLANERVALSKSSVMEAFSEANVAYLKGDWTNNDPLITELLRQYDRSGVPLYLLFPADASEPAQILPQILTPSVVIDAVRAI